MIVFTVLLGGCESEKAEVVITGFGEQAAAEKAAAEKAAAEKAAAEKAAAEKAAAEKAAAEKAAAEKAAAEKAAAEKAAAEKAVIEKAAVEHAAALAQIKASQELEKLFEECDIYGKQFIKYKHLIAKAGKSGDYRCLKRSPTSCLKKYGLMSDQINLLSQVPFSISSFELCKNLGAFLILRTKGREYSSIIKKYKSVVGFDVSYFDAEFKKRCPGLSCKICFDDSHCGGSWSSCGDSLRMC